MSKRYRDKYGDLWVCVSEVYIKRLKDGNIGGWQNGEGLEEV